MKSEYVQQALAKVGNPNILVNLISRRVRQLTNGSGGHPLIDETAKMGWADIALLEIIHGKMDYTMSTATQEEEEEEVVPVGRKRRR